MASKEDWLAYADRLYAKGVDVIIDDAPAMLVIVIAPDTL